MDKEFFGGKLLATVSLLTPATTLLPLLREEIDLANSASREPSRFLILNQKI